MKINLNYLHNRAIAVELVKASGSVTADVEIETHLDELRGKIVEFQAMVDTLQHLADRCDGDKRPDCRILHDLERSEP